MSDTAQLTMWPTGALARKTDPDTSRSAAPSAFILSELQGLVLDTHRQHAETGLTDDELIRFFPHVNDGTLRKRRCELAHAGLVVDSGERRPVAATGRLAVVWRYAPAT